VSVYPAWIVLNDDDDNQFCIYKRIAGHPRLVVYELCSALEYGRKALTTAEFAARICCAIGPKSIRPVELAWAPDYRRARFRYDIFFQARRFPSIQVTELSDGGDESIIYSGKLENWLSKAMRIHRRRKPTPDKPQPRKLGRPPIAGFVEISDEEMEQRQRRAQADAPHLDLTGVKIFTSEELAARKEDRKRQAARERRLQRKNR
jgi:hypothetical protein